jgi:prevent-host-death family protein
MPTIPQRELRNHVSDVLRRAEGGERFTITVNGRPVAELGPPAASRRLATGARLKRILSDTPVDASWAAELQHLRDEERAAASQAPD